MNPIVGPSYWGYAKSDASSTWISRQNGRCGAARVETGGESGNPQTESLQIASIQTASWNRCRAKAEVEAKENMKLSIHISNIEFCCLQLKTFVQFSHTPHKRVWAPEPNGFEVQDVKWFSCNLFGDVSRKAELFVLHITYQWKIAGGSLWHLEVDNIHINICQYMRTLKVDIYMFI